MKVLLSTVILALATAQAVAGGYVTAVDGSIVKTGSNLCLRNGFWTPAEADACNGVAKKATAPVVTKVSLQAETLFDFDKSDLKPAGRAELDKLATKIGGIKVDVLIAVGHTDSIGTAAYNMKLGKRRADAVAKYLASKGVKDVYTESKGKTQPVASNSTAEGRAKNRRVDIEVIGTTK
jgi:OOP family OmpA-OmpF porin